MASSSLASNSADCSVTKADRPVPADPRPDRDRPKRASQILWILLLVVIALAWNEVWAAAVRVVPTLNAQVHPHRFLFVAVFLLAVFIVLEIDRRARRLPGWWRESTMVLVFLPVLVVLGPRNRFMAETAAAVRMPSRRSA